VSKAALAAAKARGVKLGGPKLKQAQRGIASNKANADRFAANVVPVIEQIKASGATSLRAIAKALFEYRACAEHSRNHAYQKTRAALRRLAAASGTPVQVTAVLRRAS